MKKPWAGRFKDKTKKTVDVFTSSVSSDKRLWKYDIEGSIAHAKMLGKQKIISAEDTRLILVGLSRIKQEIQKGRFKFRDDLEDVHMNIEHALINIIGPAGGKLHTARSRNDQVALDLRLFLRHEIGEILKLITGLQKKLVSIAEKNIGSVMPGYTHLQKAQPVLLSHHMLAYFEMLDRDLHRFEDCTGRVNVLPLGSGALAGTTLPIDRKYVARLLNFPSVSENSMDAVSDRDFIIEFLSASSLLMTHLSRLAEELVIWNSGEFGFIELPDSYATGSSIMPQKKNPDVLELIRGKSGAVISNLLGMFIILKGLPLTYNRDLQEDKPLLFQTVDTVKACLSILVEIMPRIKFKRQAMKKASESGYLTATDIAEYLAGKGVPFREAHRVTGEIVKYCINKKKSLLDTDISEFRRFSKEIDKDIYKYISVEASINRRDSYGGTARKRVTARIKKLKKTL